MDSIGMFSLQEEGYSRLRGDDYDYLHEKVLHCSMPILRNDHVETLIAILNLQSTNMYIR